MAITNGYATLAQVKASLRITDSVDDALIELAIEAASREIDSATERQFFPTTATRIYRPQDSYITQIDDLNSLTTLKTSSAADGKRTGNWSAGTGTSPQLSQCTIGIGQPQ